MKASYGPADDGVEVGGAFRIQSRRYDVQGPNPNGIGRHQSRARIHYTPNGKFNLHGTYHLPIDKAYGDVPLTAVYKLDRRPGERRGVACPIRSTMSIPPMTIST